MKLVCAYGALPGAAAMVAYYLPPDCMDKQALAEELSRQLGLGDAEGVAVQGVGRAALRACLAGLEDTCRALAEATTELAEAHGITRIWFFPKPLYWFRRRADALAFAEWAAPLPAEDICLCRMSCRVNGAGRALVGSPAELCSQC